MYATTRKTRICTLETLDEKLRAAIHAHETEYGLEDIQCDILMCCETISARRQKGGGIKTTLSAAYVTPKWLVWVDSANPDDAQVGTAQLNHINVSQYRNSISYILIPDQWLNITGRYTDKNNTGRAYIVLDFESEGQRFRGVLEKALSKVTNSLA
jgi:hypothetical protein